MVLDATPMFVQISTCSNATGAVTIIALDERGCVWCYCEEERHWFILPMLYDTERKY
jgi:hypothetical protein